MAGINWVNTSIASLNRPKHVVKLLNLGILPSPHGGGFFMPTNPAREERHYVPAQGEMETNMADENLDPMDPEGEGLKNEPDWKALARKWENRAKENSEKAKAFDESQAKLTELEERAQKAEEELASAQAKATRSALLSKIASETGIPAEFLQGETEEDIRKFAKAMSDWYKPVAPKVSNPGKFDSNTDEFVAAKQKLARDVFGN